MYGKSPAPSSQAEHWAAPLAEVARTPGPGHGLKDVRERLGRILEREEGRTHESTCEELSATLGRARPSVREGPTHDEELDREEQVRRHRERGRGGGL